jgi:Secretion system C-terminal sorting domain
MNMKINFTSIVLLVFCLNTMAQDPAYPPAPAAPLNIVKAEYFIDNDPGFGLATDIPLTAAPEIGNLAPTIDISSLTPGAHYLIVRTLNAESQWSITTVKTFGIDPTYPIVTPPALNIVKAEYSIDANLDFGMATDIPITPATDIANLMTSISLGSLAPGAHNLILRTQNAEGEWSITSTQPFGIDPAYPPIVPTAQNIVKAEYFFGTDPGFGMAIDIPLTAAVDIPNLMANTNISSLALGSHNLILRTQNAEGDWSLTSLKTFGIDPAYPPAPTPIGNITRIEYFYDKDPGFGNGIAAAITPATEIANLDITASLGGLLAGTHKFYIRCLDDWSITAVKDFNLPADVLPLTLLHFTGKATEKGSELSWKTANEKNFSHFEVERSSHLAPSGGTLSGKFERIGEVKGNKGENYEFIDAYAPTGGQVASYYRLKMVDLDGTSAYSKVIFIGLQDFPGFKNLGSLKAIVGNFYPNPTQGKAQIDITTNETGHWNITTYDLTGKLLNSEAKLLQKGLNKISIEKLEQGVNFVRFDNGFITTIRKIINQ